MSARWRRRFAIAFALLLVAIVALRLFLYSGLAARLVSTDLGKLLETNVRIGTLRAVLVGDSIVRNVRFFDENGDIPYLEAEQITVDLSLSSLLFGKTLPDRIEMDGVRLHLRFDQSGKLLTQLPKLPEAGRLPHLRLRDLTVTLEQKGRPPLTLQRASVTLSPEQAENLIGWIDDPLLGRFDLRGRFGQGRLYLRLTNNDLPLTAQRFADLPFIPRQLTQRLQVEGEVPLRLELWLATTRPQCRYRVAFGPAQARLLDDDRPALLVSGVGGVLSGDDYGFDFEGDVEDPHWGTWVIDCRLVENEIQLNLHAEEVTFDPICLRQIPYVPVVVWEQLEAVGRSSVKLHARLSMDNPETHYRIELSPRLDALRLIKLDLDATDVTGQILIEDGIVQLIGMKGRLAEGSVAVTGRLDYLAEPMQSSLCLDVSALRLSSLPRSWQLPPRIDALLTGGANLRLSVDGQGQGGIEIHADGLARLDDAGFAGYALHEPIELALRGNDLDVRLDVSHFDLAELGRHLGASLSGKATLRTRLHLPLDRAADRSTWRGVARFSADKFTVNDVPVRDLTIDLAMRNGFLRVVDAQAEVARGRLRGQLAFDLSTFEGRGSVLGRGFDLPPGWCLERFSTNVVVDRDRLLCKETRIHVPGGVITGWGHLNWVDRSTRAEMFVRDLDANRLLHVLTRKTWPVRGELSGQISAWHHPGEYPAFQFDLFTDQLTLWRIPVRNLSGRLDHTGGRVSYRLSGETLAGRASVQGHYPSIDEEPSGQLKLEQIRLATLWEVLGFRGVLTQLRGTASLNLPYFHHPTHLLPVGRGRFEVRDLQWRDGELMDLFSGDVLLSIEGISLRDAEGILAGGQLRLNGNWRFDDSSRSWFNLRVLGADLGRVSSLNDDLEQAIDGPLDVSLRGNLGSEWRGSGAVSLSRGKVFGIEVSDWRIPVEFTFLPSIQRAEISVRESSAQIGTGRGRLRAALRYSGYWRLEGQLLFFDAGLRSLAGLLGDVTSFARGRVTGRVDFSASEFRSLNDLNATVHAKLNDAQALQLPILRLLVPHVMPGRGGLDLRAGEMRGRLSNGVFRISEWTLDSSLLLLHVQGSVTVQGRLDLDVMAQTTSTGIDPVALRGLTRWLPPVGPVPLGVLVRLTEAMSDRVIHLRIAGTVRSPRVQVEPLRLLSDQAARFFLNRALEVGQP